MIVVVVVVVVVVAVVVAAVKHGVQILSQAEVEMKEVQTHDSLRRVWMLWVEVWL
jgi:hypothetical protein